MSKGNIQICRWQREDGIGIVDNKQPGLTYVKDLLPEGFIPALRVFRYVQSQCVGYILSMTLCADVESLRMDGISLERTEKGILTEKG